MVVSKGTLLSCYINVRGGLTFCFGCGYLEMNSIVMLHQCKKVLVTTKDRWRIWKLQMTLELKKALSFHSFCTLFCKLVERLDAKPFSCVFYALSVWFVFFFLLLSSFKLVESFQPYQKLMCVCTWCFKCACQCAFVFFFQGFIFIERFQSALFYMLHSPPCNLPSTTF